VAVPVRQTGDCGAGRLDEALAEEDSSRVIEISVKQIPLAIDRYASIEYRQQDTRVSGMNVPGSGDGEALMSVVCLAGNTILEYWM
jgi:hypothetical protein